MAEPAKTQPDSKPRTRVVDMRTGEGGIEMPGFTTRSSLRLSEPWAKQHELDMELDRALGGLVVRYTVRGPDGKPLRHTLLVPMAHLRMLELEGL